MSDRVRARPDTESQDRGQRRQPRKPTPARLERIALHYLGRYASSAETLRRLLRRRVARAAAVMAVDQEEAEGWIAEVVANLQKLGLLNDATYAAARARSLHRQGRSSRHIRASLRDKGVEAELIEAAVSARAETMADPDFAAACHYARRRRLGPYSHKQASEERQKGELAALGRAGFSYAIARKIVDAGSREALEGDALERIPDPL